MTSREVMTLKVTGLPANRSKKLLKTWSKLMVFTAGTETPLENVLAVGVTLLHKQDVSSSVVLLPI